MVKRFANSDDGNNGDANLEEGQRQNKQQRVDESLTEKSTADAGSNNEIATGANLSDTEPKEAICSGCGITESAAPGALLLLFDDPEEDNKEEDDQQGGAAASKDEKR